MIQPIGIEVRNVKKKLGVNQALDGVSLHFAEGLMHGLIGPEGAGKTTLLRTLIELLHPNEGEIIYTRAGERVNFESLGAQIAYMPQAQSLYADLSIDEHLAFFRDLYQIPQKEFLEKRAELLSITRLEKFVDRPAGKLSGGMYKKLGLSCALLRSPAAILLDEPTNGVDPISRREFWDLLYRLSEQKILIIFATAYMDEAERCAQVHLLDTGRKIGEGEPKQLLADSNVASFDELFLKRSREGNHHALD